MFLQPQRPSQTPGSDGSAFRGDNPPRGLEPQANGARRSTSTGAPPAASYAALWCKSHFSFLEGASSPGELVAAARQLGLNALAITDRDGVYGVARAHVAAKELGVKLIIGSEVTVGAEEDLAAGDNAGSGSAGAGSAGTDSTAGDSPLVLLARNREGYANLCRLLTRGRLRSPKGQSRVSWQEVAEHADGMIALWGGPAADELETTAALLRDAFANRLYALVARHHDPTEPRREQRLREKAARFGLPVVAAIEVLYHTHTRRPLQDVLTCIRHGVALGDAGRRIKPNDHFRLKNPAIFSRLFRDDPDAIARTREIADRCDFSLDQLHYRYPSERLPAGMTSAERLEQLTREGARKRFGEKLPRRLREQIRRELQLIHDLDYDGYFLTMWEIVQFCQQEGIICQGRGSAANSVVCYCLEVTAVNPQEVDLLFERFISRERAEPPDIDLDIEHDRREEVIQHVYRKYGRDRAAMVANFIRYRPKSAIREVGKALGLPATNLDRLAKMVSYREMLSSDDLRTAGLDPDSPVHTLLLQLVDEILDFPRHLSIHPGGFLLGHEPVHDLVPIENGSMPERTVIQWDKRDVETLNLFKVDLLGLGALNQLHHCFDLLREHRGVEMGLADIPRGDTPTFDMLCSADAVGVFQVESRAQMNMLPRLRPRCYYDLVIEVAIVRPGPITGGMVHPFINRRHGNEQVTYPHPALEPVLRKTLGVPLFQEQVMRLAMIAADYSPGEADQLRRDMATWSRHGPLERHRERLISRMMAKGIAREFAKRVFAQIRGFGEYGFPESHAASFALIAYATAWMKCHYHAEFSCALLNALPMGFYSAATIVEDAKRHGIEVRAICVNSSLWDCTLEEACAEPPGGHISGQHPDPNPGPSPGQDSWQDRPLAIRMGLGFVKGLGEQDREAIAQAKTGRPFASVADFVQRVDLHVDKLTALVEAGAFSSLQPDRRSALWETRGLGRRERAGRTGTGGRTGVGGRTGTGERAGRGERVAGSRRTTVVQRASSSIQLTLPLKERETTPGFTRLTALETINWDHRTSRHSTRGHPLAELRDELRGLGLPDAKTVAGLPDGRTAHYAGIVICRQRPGTAKDVTFLTLEDETGFVNLVVWANVFKRYRIEIKTMSFMGVSGTIQSDQGVVHLIVDRVWRPRVGREPVAKRSRDFH